MDIENSASFEVALGEGIHLMLGSGFSVLAKDAAGHLLPVGTVLADELRHEFDLDESRRLSLPQLYTILSARDREAADDFLRRRFTVATFDPRYSALKKMKISMIFTTNIDNLIWRVYEDSRVQYLNDIVTRGPQFRDRSSIDYAPLHGSVLDDTRPFRFTSIEVASSFNADGFVNALRVASNRGHWCSNHADMMMTLFYLRLAENLAKVGQTVTAEDIFKKHLTTSYPALSTHLTDMVA